MARQKKPAKVKYLYVHVIYTFLYIIFLILFHFLFFYQFVTSALSAINQQVPVRDGAFHTSQAPDDIDMSLAVDGAAKCNAAPPTIGIADSRASSNFSADNKSGHDVSSVL